MTRHFWYLLTAKNYWGRNNDPVEIKRILSDAELNGDHAGVNHIRIAGIIQEL